MSFEQRRPLLCFCAGFCLAALVAVLLFLGGVQIGGILVLFGCSCIAAALAMVAVPRLRRPVSLAGLVAGVLWCALFIGLRYMPAVQLSGRTAAVSFVADGYAVGYGSYGVLDGSIVAVDGQPVRLKARLYLDDGSPDMEPGERLDFSGRLAAADTGYTRGHLANGRYLTVSQKGPITRSGTTGLTLRQRGARIAASIGQRIDTLLQGDQAAMLTALLTGNRSRFSQTMSSALQDSGASHITAVSGLHVSILVAFWVALWGKRIGLYTVMPLVLCYAAIAGFSPSIMRAAMMCGMTALAFAVKREKDALSALFVALFVLVVVNPFSILSASLALSFGSTLGIILFSPMLTRGLRRVIPRIRGPLDRVLNYLCSTTASSVASMAFTLPLCMVFFSRVSLVSALTTFLVLWAVSLSMILGLALVAMSFFWQGGAVFLARWVLYWPLSYMVRVISFFGGQRWVAQSTSLYFMLAALVLALALVASRARRMPGGSALALCLCAFCAFFALTSLERELYSDLIIHNTGSATIMLTRTGDTASAVNTGGNDGGRSAAFLDEVLSAWGISHLEHVVLTGSSYQQSGGLDRLLDRIHVETLLLPLGIDTPSGAVDSLAYQDSGSLELGAFTLTLIAADQERYIPVVNGESFTLIDLCGIQPHAALLALEGVDRCDVLVVDAGYVEAPTTYGRLCSRLLPQLVLMAGDSYSGIYDLEQQSTVPVVDLWQSGDISIAQLNAGLKR